MFRHFAKRALKLAEFKNHRSLRSGISNSVALRRYATASAAAESAEEIGDRRIGSEKFGDLRRRQVKEETGAWEKAVDEYMELTEIMCQKKLAPNLPYFKSLLLGWFEPLRDAIVGDQKGWDKKKVSKCTYEHISTLPPDMAAVITMHKLMSLLMTSSDAVGSVRVVQAVSQIGEAVEQEARLHRFLERTKKSKSDVELQRVVKKVTKLLGNNKVIEASKIVKKQDDLEPWGLDGQIKVGARLVQLLMETAYIHLPVDRIGDVPPDLRPAFTHNLKTVTMVAQKTSRRFGVIECHPLILKGLEKAARHTVIPYMPMLVPPKKWTGYDRGGFLYLPSYVMRTHGVRQQSNSLKRTPKKQLELVFESLNSLGSTKWRVNIRMLDVIDRIWSSGGSLAGLISCSEIPLPIKPETEDESEIRKWRWKVKVAHKNNKQRHAQQCDIELKLSVARKMKGEEGFYYPHNIDFRGRAYPMHSHLNHLGSDLCRGILEFAEGRPLGKSGLQWLKIHLANVYGGGVDKLSFDGRISFAEDHISHIFDSADRPLKGTRWWMEAEDPLQCLATCINLSDALRSPSPESTLSHMPVHQDGSCNGLQHYAALGRDKLGAAVVNLIAGDKPTDVYSGVAARVLDIMRSDAMDSPESNPNALRARSMINQVDRKLVKQTVMTSVYGVTYVGARDQIKKRLKERDAFADDSELFAAACYAAKTTLTAIGEMFEAARSIMAWLSDCAKVIASDNHAVQWTTPLGLPVVQPYQKFTRHRVETSLQSISLQRETDNIMPRWQRTAFPANFVHSLDGSHMMMTAVACRKAGLDFAGVHDSYWTHACDVDTMNKILREKFVELYEAPLLENMLENFKKTYPNSDFPRLPEQGDFDLTEVLKSPYFFN